MLKKKHYIIIASVLCLSLILIYVVFGQAIYGRITAPKLTGVEYTETRYERQSFCLFTCKYYPLYNYTASGSQKAIIEGIANDLKALEYTYRLREGESKPKVGCYGKIGDRYQFKRPSADNNYSEDITVTFYSNEPGNDAYSNEIGCGRPDSKYRIEIWGIENNWLGR